MVKFELALSIALCIALCVALCVELCIELCVVHVLNLFVKTCLLKLVC